MHSKCQSKPVPILCKSSANLWCQARVNRSSIRCQSSTNPLTIRQSNANPCQSMSTHTDVSQIADGTSTIRTDYWSQDSMIQLPLILVNHCILLSNSLPILDQSIVNLLPTSAREDCPTRNSSIGCQSSANITQSLLRPMLYQSVNPTPILVNQCQSIRTFRK